MRASARLAIGDERKTAVELIKANHYTRSVPSGKSHYVLFQDAVIVFSIPANKNISTWLLNKPNAVWELARLWAPDGHAPNLLTQSISAAASVLEQIEPDVEALVSYADPNVGHSGGVYRAASWVFLGQCEENRAYRDSSGNIFSRRAFHSGKKSLTKAEILAKGFIQLKLPGKIRFAKGLTRTARKQIEAKRL